MHRDTRNALPMPSCAQARSCGLTMPPLLSDMEAAIGADATAAFLNRYAGRRVEIPVRPIKTLHGDLRAAFDWLREELGFGQITIPLGPASASARTLWTVRRLSREGLSSGAIAHRVGTSERTVQRYRARLRAHGHDLSPNTDRTPDR